MNPSNPLDILVDSTLESLKQVIPQSFTAKTVLTSPADAAGQVSIEILGDIEGILLIKEEGNVFKHLAEGMFGMILEGDMLQSFIGEFGNMVAGQLATNISQKGFRMDITPPHAEARPELMDRLHCGTLPVELANGGELHFSFFLKTEAA